MERTNGCRNFWSYWRTYVFLLTPVLVAPLPIAIRVIYDTEIDCTCNTTCPTVNSVEKTAAHPYYQMSKAAYVLLVMAIYWITECIPIAVTALVPVVLMPIMGLLKSSTVSPLYFKDINMMFMGGLIVAVSVERWNLHKRIALRILTLFGTKPRWLLMGFMLPAWFLSMWISNTATTAMMIPIVEAVLTQMKVHEKEKQSETPHNGVDNNSFAVSSDNVATQKTEEVELAEVTLKTVSAEDTEEVQETNTETDHQYEMFDKCLSLSVAYAATTGGISTLTGTAPNLVMKEQADIAFINAGIPEGSGINFAGWMTFGLPTSAVMLILTWIWLQIWFLGFKEMFRRKDTEKERIIHQVLRQEYAKLGKLTFAEGAVLGHFVLLALLWITKAPGGRENGWEVIMPKGFTSDATPALLIATSLFFFPARRPNWMCCRRSGDTSQGPIRPLLTWPEAQSRVPFGVMFLLGGGFALAEASSTTGLSSWIGDKLQVFGDLDQVVMLIILVTITAALTEVTSNTAMASILMPIFAQMAIGLGRNPLYLMFPTALACSFAFMLPVATPPNAVVFSYGRLRVPDMMKAGVALNIIAILVVTLATNTWGMSFFNFSSVPEGLQMDQSNNGTKTLCQLYVDLDALCAKSAASSAH